MFAAIRTLNRLGSATAPISNLPGGFGPLRMLLGRAVGIAPQRPLPRFERQNLLRWFRRHPAPADAPAPTQGTVNFLADSFTSFTEPHIGRTAIELLEAAGWTVELVSSGCCGRAALSKGLVDQAAAQARALVTALATGTVPDSPIVGCEPSCLFTLRDEHGSLLAGDPHVGAVAGRVRQVEELLGAAIDDGRLTLAADSWLAGRRVLYHGHCHQKAEVGTAATTALLRRIPGIELVELDAGCCGMAGSFGYEAEHYEISMTVGRDRLFPAVEAEGPDTVVAATGTSCREQIGHGTRREAWHPIELVAQALVPAAAGGGPAAERRRPRRS